jgi:hypothetical protein
VKDVKIHGPSLLLSEAEVWQAIGVSSQRGLSTSRELTVGQIVIGIGVRDRSIPVTEHDELKKRAARSSGRKSVGREVVRKTAVDTGSLSLNASYLGLFVERRVRKNRHG